MTVEYFLLPARSARDCTIIPIAEARMRIKAGQSYLFETTVLNPVAIVFLEGHGGRILLRKGFDPDWDEILAYSAHGG